MDKRYFSLAQGFSQVDEVSEVRFQKIGALVHTVQADLMELYTLLKLAQGIVDDESRLFNPLIEEVQLRIKGMSDELSEIAD